MLDSLTTFGGGECGKKTTPKVLDVLSSTPNEVRGASRGRTHETEAPQQGNLPKGNIMSERTSNKQILDAILALTDAITSTTIAPVVNATPVAAVETADVEVDGAYLEHLQAKAAAHATAKGEDVVLYARRNKAGETKLAYALASRWDDKVKGQPSTLGVVDTYQPAS